MNTVETVIPPRTMVENWMRHFQDWLCYRLELADGSGVKFQETLWEHAGGGGGRTRVLLHGDVLEKSGVAFSAVRGGLTEQAAQVLLLPNRWYFATGVSVVQHPRSPMVPIAHMNVRYFEAGNGEAWFGGGLDLTPIYVDEAQTCWFHEQIRETCQRHDASYYSRFKKWADEYFYLPHRKETRGVGGIFFDRLTVGQDGSFEELFAFVQDVGELYGRTYATIMRQNRDLPFTEREKQWQQVRRSRYAEFNLAIDRGTRFGLETGGRTESILMSLPPQAEWHYNYTVEPGSPEEATQQWLRQGVEWAPVSSVPA